MARGDGQVSEIAAVVIGRNEGDRLIACLKSLGGVARVVYVDSGSTDGSPAAARNLGADVVALDMTQPFTAARARNAGLDALRDDPPTYVQFVDGDCVLQPGWIDTARAFLDDHPKVAMACGRRREIHPEASVYNRLCDDEWNTPVGEALACGGDALGRWEALDVVGGYNPTLIAGEEPDLCLRLRVAGWKIWRIDAEMTAHDAAILRFGQWWKRVSRAGHAFAEGAWLHGKSQGHWVGETRRLLVWGLGLPLATLLAVLLAGPWGLVLLALYPV
ncbi:MAG: glycosyltransferase, partial [Maritimibacter sp.]|nr:glycosyltransferase [Maritimibacter sp.]